MDLELNRKDYNEGNIGVTEYCQPVNAEVQFVDVYDSAGNLIKEPKNSFEREEQAFLNSVFEGVDEWHQEKCFANESQESETYTFFVIGFNKDNNTFYIKREFEKDFDYDNDFDGSMYEQHNTLWGL